MLEALRSILRAEGRLSLTLFRGAPNTLSKEGYRRGFGSLVRAYDLAGYNSPLKATVIHRAEIRKVRRELMENLVRLFPGSIVLLATNRGAVFYRPVCLSPTRSESEFYSFHSFLDCAAIQVGVGDICRGPKAEGDDSLLVPAEHSQFIHTCTWNGAFVICCDSNNSFGIMVPGGGSRTPKTRRSADFESESCVC